MLKFEDIKKPAMAGFFIFQILIIVRECLGTKIALTEIVFCKELSKKTSFFLKEIQFQSMHHHHYHVSLNH
jgi:hypothetical protein